MPLLSGIWTVSQVTQAIQNQNWTNIPPPTIQYLVVAGGGGGGGSSSNSGGGGGGGGVIAGFAGVTSGTQFWVTVGGGGAGGTNAVGTNGSNSVLLATSSGASTGNFVASGGGGGASQGKGAGSSGGSGGGGAFNLVGGAGTSGQGNSGGNTADTSGVNAAAGGGGGAGTNGLTGSQNTTDIRNAGAGGTGIASDISGTRTTYAGGGGASAFNYGAGAGGSGGGGAGSTTTTGTSGTANTGGGGGGANTGGGGSSNVGGSGGSGIVIISYPDTYAAAASTTGSPTITTSGSGSIYFTGSTSVYLSTATNSSSFAFGTGDFTIEGWIYTIASGTYTFYDQRASGVNDLSPTLYLSANAITFYTNGSDRINGGSLTNATWNHFALVRISGSTKLYLNGAQTGSTYTDSNNYINTSGRPFIGGGSIVTGQNPLNGYITNLRVVKGVGVYTGAFTVPTSPLQATQSAGTNIAAISGSQTSLLLNAVSGGYLADSSTLANTFSISTQPTWNAASPFPTGGGFKNRVYQWTSSGSITF